MFEKASKIKLRFETPKGLLTVEDLWDIPLTGNGANLDDIAKGLYRKLNTDDVESFVVKVKSHDALTQLAFDIVTHIINVRLEVAEKAEKAVALREKKQKIMSIMAMKEDQSLQESSMEDLRKMLDEL